ncbi:MAG TPA: hypothetical protein ENN60_03505 [archaeon]|nr:hypothetical protein [archaeon]
MRVKTPAASSRVTIWCPFRPKEPYTGAIRELAGRASVSLAFTKNPPAGDQVALDPNGEPLTPDKLHSLLSNHGDLTFLVGGPDGFTSGQPACDPAYSLGPFTLNHQVAVLVLLDLLFRTRFPEHPYNRH